MTKYWNCLKTLIGKLNFSGARLSLAGDLKTASFGSLALWFLSVLSHFPQVFSALPKVLGFELVPVTASAWVSWLLFGVAVVLYVLQLLMRVTLKSSSSISSGSC